MAIIGAAFPIAILVGPVLGGAHHRLLGVAVGLLDQHPGRSGALALAFIAVPHIWSRASCRRHFDVAGAAVFTTALVALVLAASWASERRPGPATAAALAVSIAGFIAFFADRTACGRTHRAAALLRQPHHRGGHRALGNHRGRPLLDHCLPAHVHPDGVPDLGHRFRPRPHRNGVRDAGQQPAHRVARQPDGPYRIFPILGTAMAAAGLLVMALLPPGLPLWVPMMVMAVVGMGTGAFMSLIVAVVAERGPAQPRPAPSQRRSTWCGRWGRQSATAIIGGVIGFGVAVCLPAGLDAATLTPALGARGRTGSPGRGRRRSTVRALHPSSSPWRPSTPSASSQRSCSERPPLRRTRSRSARHLPKSSSA